MTSYLTTLRLGLLCVICWTPASALAQAIPNPPSVEVAQSSTSPAVINATAPDTTPSLGSLFGDLRHDIRRLPTRTNAIWIGTAGVLALAVHGEDARITRDAVASDRLDRFVEGGYFVGGGTVQAGAALATYTLGRVMHRPALATVGADLVRGQIINVALTQGIKIAVDRQRPDGTRFSFPSGHSSATFTTATVLQRHFGAKLGLPAYVMATYVAASRLHDNKHYPSDVIFGAGIGIVSGRAVTIGRGRNTFALGPLTAPGGLGLALTRIEGR
jgi:membrane-associated phospholipid phosphatase